MPIKSGAQAIKEAMEEILGRDKLSFVIGEGVPDPKGCFTTTTGLKEKFPKQVFDMPISENGITGVCVGAAAAGLRPIMVHMRADFLMYAMDQIVNMAAKLHFMYSGQLNCPLVIRAIVGRGWGQGCQHSQHLEEMFAMVPGLKVVMPSNPYNAKGLLIAAAKDNNPVIYFEHRWLHSMTGEVPDGSYETKLFEYRVVKKGDKLALVTQGYMVSVCLKAAEFLERQGISVTVIDRLTIGPEYRYPEPFIKVREIKEWYNPTPPAPSLSKKYYTSVIDVMRLVNKQLGCLVDYTDALEHEKTIVHDVPHKDFMGPF